MKTNIQDSKLLADLVSVGPATLRDFARLGIGTVGELARQDPLDLYRRMCELEGKRVDPCLHDVFSAAVAQARDPNLPDDQKRWWYWSSVRKHGADSKTSKRSSDAQARTG